ncbi:MAG: cyclase family protein [Candidatus Lindowbacteria bacterium]|nr:cyclase family protein [Candidatus Lindowbacteria bacterium]
MKYYDITVPIRAGMPVYEGDPAVEITSISSIAKGDPCNVSRLILSTHTGTHIDAPLHFIKDGNSIDEIPMNILVGRAVVVEITDPIEISRQALIAAPLKGERRVLFKTSNSNLWKENDFQKQFVYMAEDAAKHLVEIGVKLIGIDYLSVGRFGSTTFATHLTLLDAGIVVVEGLNLAGIEPGNYELVCLPLRIAKGDGSPCRAVLIEI